MLKVQSHKNGSCKALLNLKDLHLFLFIYHDTLCPCLPHVSLWWQGGYPHSLSLPLSPSQIEQLDRQMDTWHEHSELGWMTPNKLVVFLNLVQSSLFQVCMCHTFYSNSLRRPLLILFCWYLDRPSHGYEWLRWGGPAAWSVSLHVIIAFIWRRPFPPFFENTTARFDLRLDLRTLEGVQCWQIHLLQAGYCDSHE